MTPFPPPPLEQLQAVLRSVLARTLEHGAALRILERAPLDHGSSAACEIVSCAGVPGLSPRIFCKFGQPADECAYGHRGGTAREAIVYGEVLAPLEVSRPRFYGSYLNPETGQTWVFLEYLDGATRLTKSPDPAALPGAAGWLGAFQARAEARLQSGFRPALGNYDQQYFTGWLERAQRFLNRPGGPLAWLEQAGTCYRKAIEVLLEEPATVVHGEFYPKNILWGNGAAAPVDWESTVVGKGEIDLAALLEGWNEAVIERCLSAYTRARWPGGAPPSFARALAAARFYLAFRWLGDRPEWTQGEEAEDRMATLRQLAKSWPEPATP